MGQANLTLEQLIEAAKKLSREDHLKLIESLLPRNPDAKLDSGLSAEQVAQQVNHLVQVLREEGCQLANAGNWLSDVEEDSDLMVLVNLNADELNA